MIKPKIYKRLNVIIYMYKSYTKYSPFQKFHIGEKPSIL